MGKPSIGTRNEYLYRVGVGQVHVYWTTYVPQWTRKLFTFTRYKETALLTCGILQMRIWFVRQRSDPSLEQTNKWDSSKKTLLYVCIGILKTLTIITGYLLASKWFTGNPCNSYVKKIHSAIFFVAVHWVHNHFWSWDEEIPLHS